MVQCGTCSFHNRVSNDHSSLSCAVNEMKHRALRSLVTVRLGVPLCDIFRCSNHRAVGQRWFAISTHNFEAQLMLFGGSDLESSIFIVTHYQAAIKRSTSLIRSMLLHFTVACSKLLQKLVWLWGHSERKLKGDATSNFISAKRQEETGLV